MTLAKASGLNEAWIDNRRRRSRAVVEFCLVRAERLAVRSPPRSAEWAHVAARVADAYGCGAFALPRLEQMAVALARGIGTTPQENSRPARRRWLHVLTAAYEIGGHTALVRRWIETDDSGDEHHLVLTDMTELPLHDFSDAVARTGGKVTLLGAASDLTKRASQLRDLAAKADAVVLHHHMWDIVPTIAFGVPGGPPVLVFNHADHTFWVGAAIADLVANLRPVGADLNRRYRGVERNFMLPIPLPPPPDPDELAKDREATRSLLGIPAQAVLFVTVGSAFKYAPLGGLDFLAMVRRLLAELPVAYLVAVGPDPMEPNWRQAILDLHPRLMALGPRYPVTRYHAAADIYIEGFPFGSTTALLEAALAGLPVVSSPASALRPLAAHGHPMSLIPQPADVDAYLEQALTLARSPETRSAQTAMLRPAIIASNCGEGWRARLRELRGAIPAEHRIYDVPTVMTDETLDRFWTQFLATRRRIGPEVFAAALWARMRLRALQRA